MPYLNRTGGWERARSIGHVPLTENTFVQERLRAWRVLAHEPLGDIDPQLLVPADALGAPGDDRRWVLSFDGSMQEVAVREAYPSTRIGYVQIAGVLVHLDQMLGQARERLVDPAAIRAAAEEALLPIVMLGSNVCRPDMPTVRDSWRAEVYETFAGRMVEEIPLLDVFMLLVEHSDKCSGTGGVVLARCSASDACTARNIDVPAGGATCPSCGGRLFPTDALRIHEEVVEEHENATALGRLMTVLEQITMAAYLHFLLQRQPRVLSAVGFILDGPLALFGPQAWLHGPMLAFIHAVRRRLQDRRLRSPVIIGIEKGGQFAEHAAALGDRIPRRCLMMLPDDYIYRHILTFRESPQTTFGRDTYYGQKFFYRTAQGQLLTITVPRLDAPSVDACDPAAHPVMPDTLRLLDRIGTTLYQDAVIPIALAHAFASIPLRTGSKVLTLLSRDLLGQPARSRA